MNPCSFLSVVEVLRDEALAVAVGVKVDSSCRDHAGKVRSKPFKECPPALDSRDCEQDLESLANV